MKNIVLEFLENQYDALDIIKINDGLGLTSADELRELQTVLEELVHDLTVYQTKKNKYILYTKCPNFKKGKLQINKKGFGFVLLEDEEDIHISKDNLGFALDGDLVLVEVLGSNKNRPEGKILKVLERNLKNIVGIIKSDGKDVYFKPYNNVDNITLIIDEDSLKDCVEGEIVVASITNDLGKNKYLAEVTQHICHKDDAKEDVLVVAANYDIYHQFPKEALKQAEEMPTEVIEKDYEGRKDLRDKVIFTIDGADTHDIDDAISLEIKDGYYELGVHIADVSYYVTENSPLDVEALTRGTSSYLAGYVIPQLPHKLSNGICSLNPNVERCALSLIMKIDSNGKVVDYEVFPSIIKSAKKMTYDSVNNVLMNNTIDEGYEEFADTLKLMNELAHIIREERSRRGASDFDVDEAKIVCDEEGVAVEVKKRTRGEGERLIEDFMIIANETIASIFMNMDLPGIYRVHDVPKPEKVQAFLQFCASTGQSIKGKFTNINPKSYQKMLEQINGSPEELQIYKALAVRSMPKAYYSPENIGHFGLASRNYLHFTSPIRRYPDLETHRLLRAFLFENRIDEKTINYYENNLGSIAKRSSERELAAVEAEREVTKMKMAEYMEHHIGEEFDAIISGVTNFGMFVQLKDNLIEGMIPVTSLGDDYFDCDVETQSLIGRNTKKVYRLGNNIRVKCVGASKENRQVDFEEVKKLDLSNESSAKKKELKHYGSY